MNQTEQLTCLLPEKYRAALRGVDLSRAEELRLRIGCPPTVLHNGIERVLRLSGRDGFVTQEDLSAIVRAVSRQSVYAVQNQLAQGFLAAPGGFRAGVCGTAVMQEGRVQGLRDLSSLCIRIPHDIRIPPERLRGALTDSCLIVGAPGWGKTTLLRACIRALSEAGERVGVVDERMELAASVGGQPQFSLGAHADVLSGFPKSEGILTLLRAMAPTWIAVDEITAPEDLKSIAAAANCGVRMLASVHASGRAELERRPLFAELLSLRVFSSYLVLDRQKQFHEERSEP